MEELIEQIQTNAQEYLHQIPEMLDFFVSELIVNYAIETFVSIRNYPKSFDDEKKLDDLKKHKNKITMAVIEIALKSGAEGESQHSENGTSRTYENGGFARSIYGDVAPFVDFLV